MMNFSDLDITTQGINFSVQPTYRFGSKRNLSSPHCYVSNETLEELAARRNCKASLPEEIFRQLENEITGVAARLSHAVGAGKTLVLRYKNFIVMDD